MSKTVVFTAHIDKLVANKFDEIAARNSRSRAGHLEFLVLKEIDENKSEPGIIQ